MKSTFDHMTSEEIMEHVDELRVQGQFKPAISLMFHLFSRDIRNCDVIIYLATLLADDLQFERAERMYQHLFKMGGDSPWMRQNYAVFLASSGRLAEANDRLCDELQRLQQQLQELKHSTADNAAEQAVEAELDLVMVTLNLAQVQLDLSDEKKAIAYAEPYLTHAKFWLHAHQIVCDAYQALKEDFGEVVQRLTSAHRASPVMVWQHCSRIALDTDDPFAASDPLFESCQFLDPSLLATVYQDYEEAQEFYDWLFDQLDRSDDPCAVDRLINLHLLYDLPLPGRDGPGTGDGTGGTKYDVDARFDNLADALAQEEYCNCAVDPGSIGYTNTAVKTQTRLWEMRGQTSIQFGSEDLPLFRRDFD